MPSLNRVLLLGLIGADLKLQRTQGGKSFVVFPVCTHEVFTAKTTGEKVTSSDWHGLIAWGVQAEAICKFCHKGSAIFIEGRLSTRIWEHEAVKRMKTMITTDHVLFLDHFNETLGTPPSVFTDPHNADPEAPFE